MSWWCGMPATLRATASTLARPGGQGAATWMVLVSWSRLKPPHSVQTSSLRLLHQGVLTLARRSVPTPALLHLLPRPLPLPQQLLQPGQLQVQSAELGRAPGHQPHISCIQCPTTWGNLASTWAHLVTTWAHLACTWGHLACTWGHLASTWHQAALQQAGYGEVVV